MSAFVPFFLRLFSGFGFHLLLLLLILLFFLLLLNYTLNDMFKDQKRYGKGKLIKEDIEIKNLCVDLILFLHAMYYL